MLSQLSARTSVSSSVTITIYAMHSYYLHATCFVHSANFKSNEDALIKFFYNQECSVYYYSMPYHHFLWEKNRIVINLARLFGKKCSLCWLIRSLTMGSNSKRCPAQTTSDPEIPTLANSFLSIRYFFLLISQFQTAHIQTQSMS